MYISFGGGLLTGRATLEQQEASMHETLAALERRARRERYAEMRAEFSAQVRQFRQTVRLYSKVVAARGRPRSGPSGMASAFAARGQTTTDNQAVPGRSSLTPRQFQIAGLIAKGYTNQQIADALVLTPGTVANHVQAILERLGLRSRTQVAVWFAQQPIRREQRAEL
jgi:DNA-binding NarL/FixJ family response regulator